MYDDILDRGIKRTIISFDPFLKRDDVKGLTDAQVGRRFGLATSTVKAMRLHQDVPFAPSRRFAMYSVASQAIS